MYQPLLTLFLNIPPQARGYIYHSYLALKVVEWPYMKWLGHDVSYLILRCNRKNMQDSYMLSSPMENLICSYMKSWLIGTVNYKGEGWLMWNYCSMYNIYCSSHVVWASALYLASNDDFDTTFSLFLFQVTKEIPRKKDKLVLELIVSGHSPQSETENPLSVNDEDKLKTKPLPGLPLRYFKTYRPASICSPVGALKNWLS